MHLVIIKKALRYIRTLLIFLFAGSLIYIISARIIYRDFYQIGSRVFKIPGIHSGFVPQGFAYWEQENTFLISGYMHWSGDAKIYQINNAGVQKAFTILNDDGSVVKNHSGGISVFGDFIYIAGCDGTCIVLSSDALINSPNNQLTPLGQFSVNNKADFCYISEGRLYVGEFYFTLRYPTDKSHHLVTPSGDSNHAIMTAYNLESEMPYGVNQTPLAVYSIPGRAQGLCLTEQDEIVISASSGYSSSNLYVYDTDIVYANSGIIELEGMSIPLYYLDRDSLVKDIALIPKSEGIVFYNDSIYILFEIASNKYMLGKFIKGDYVYRINHQDC